MNNSRFKQLREEKKLSQADLARILGIAQTSIGNYERGNRIPDTDVLIKYSDYFDVSIDYITGRSSFKRNFEDDIYKKHIEKLFVDKLNNENEIVNKYCDAALSMLIKTLNNFLNYNDINSIRSISHLCTTLSQISDNLFMDYWKADDNKKLGNNDKQNYLTFDECLDSLIHNTIQSTNNDILDIFLSYKKLIRNLHGMIDLDECDPTYNENEEE